MVFRETKHECVCRGTGVIKTAKVGVGVICSCPVGRMIAKNSVRPARELVHG